MFFLFLRSFSSNSVHVIVRDNETQEFLFIVVNVIGNVTVEGAIYDHKLATNVELTAVEGVTTREVTLQVGENFTVQPVTIENVDVEVGMEDAVMTDNVREFENVASKDSQSANENVTEVSASAAAHELTNKVSADFEMQPADPEEFTRYDIYPIPRTFSCDGKSLSLRMWLAVSAVRRRDQYNLNRPRNQHDKTTTSHITRLYNVSRASLDRLSPEWDPKMTGYLMPGIFDRRAIHRLKFRK